MEYQPYLQPFTQQTVYKYWWRRSGSIGGLDSSKFLRSDVDDTAAGALTFNGRVNIRSHLDISDGQNVDFGSSDDVRINYNGTNNWMYCDFRTGNGIVFRDNGTDTIVWKILASSDQAQIIQERSVPVLFTGTTVTSKTST